MKTSKLIFVFTIILCLQYSLKAQNKNTLTLKQCVETALANNIQVKQSGLQADVAEVNLKQAKSNLLPDLNGNFGYGFNQGRNVDPLTNSYINQQLASSNASLSSGIILFNGMRLQNLIKQTSLTYNAAKSDLQQEKDNLTLNVILAYLQVLSNEDVLAINTAQAEVTKKQLERLGVLLKEGATANYQLADLKGQLANEEIQIINSTTLLLQSKLRLCQLMNIAYNENLELEKTDVELPSSQYAFSTADIYQSSLQNLAIIKANEFKIKSAATGIRVNQAGFYPIISLNGNLGSSYSSLAQTLNPTNSTEIQTGSYVIFNNTQAPVLKQQQNYSSSKTGYTKQMNNNLGTFVGINMQIPLFNNFLNINRVKLANINLKNTQLEADNIKNLLSQNIEQAHMNMMSSYKRNEILTGQVKDFEESFRAAEVRFNTGVINSSEYIISKNNLDRSKINLAQAKYEYLFRIKILDFYQGKLSW